MVPPPPIADLLILEVLMPSWLIRKKLLSRVHRTGPVTSGTSIRFFRRAIRIHFRNNFFVPLTSTGEHPRPISGLIAPR